MYLHPVLSPFLMEGRERESLPHGNEEKEPALALEGACYFIRCGSQRSQMAPVPNIFHTADHLASVLNSSCGARIFLGISTTLRKALELRFSHRIVLSSHNISA